MPILTLGTKVPGNESSKERKFHLWNFCFRDESSRVQKFHITLRPLSSSQLH